MYFANMFCQQMKRLSLTIISNHFSRYSSNIATIDMTYNVFESAGTDNSLSPLIIMHGLFGSKQNWRAVGRALEAKTKRKIITVDARNHGESPHISEHGSMHMAADVVELMRKKNFNKACVMGHSMGGRTMMYMALKYPELVEKGIVVDISPISIPRDFFAMEELFKAMRNLNVPQNLSMIDGRRYAEEEMKRAVDSKDTVDFLLLNLRKSADGKFYWMHNVDALHKNLKNFTEFKSHIENLPSFKGQMMFICGELSNYVDPDSWPEIQKIFPNSEIHWLDAGHLVHFDQPAEFIELVVNFLKT